MNSPKIIQLPKITDPRGNLTFIEGLTHIPFDIKRAYWIYDVPGGETRGGHAFKEQEEFIVAISGSFDVVIDNGKNKERFHLNRSYMGLHVPLGQWWSMDNFSTNSLALVLASTPFSESDYIRSYEQFLRSDFDKEVVTKDKNTEVIPETAITDAHKSTVNDCQIINFDINHRNKGNMTVVENRKDLPFDIQRIYYLYDVPGGEERGGHAHKALFQLIIAAGGSFDVELFDGINTRIVSLNRPYQGLMVVPGMWRELKNFSSGSSCLVLASIKYDESDYIREIEKFKKFKNHTV